MRPGVAGAQVGHRALAGREGLGDGADVARRATSTTARSSGSWRLPSISRVDDLGPADLQLVALAAHRLDEHGQLQLAPAGDLDDVGRVGLVDADGDVAEHLALEPLAQVAGREVPALLARPAARC